MQHQLVLKIPNFNVLISSFIKKKKKSLKGHNPQKYNLYLLYIYR